MRLKQVAIVPFPPFHQVSHTLSRDKRLDYNQTGLPRNFKLIQSLHTFCRQLLVWLMEIKHRGMHCGGANEVTFPNFNPDTCASGNQHTSNASTKQNKNYSLLKYTTSPILILSAQAAACLHSDSLKYGLVGSESSRDAIWTV